MGTITLITGGVRSGKSSYALSCAASKNGIKAFIATAIPFDSEMETRVVNHKLERGDSFVTIEEPYNLSKAIQDLNAATSVAVIDCLTVWLGNLFYKHENEIDYINETIDLFVNNLQKSRIDIIMVTNEVGWGIVPDNRLSRDFRDCNGLMNQRIAKCANSVILCACGLPVKLKG